MKSLSLARPGDRLSLLCLGAHSDDIEIGAGGTILTLVAAGLELDVHWCIASAAGQREAEARTSAQAFLEGVAGSHLNVGPFKDAYLPYQAAELKTWVANLRDTNPDLVLAPRRDDAHQDHSFLSQLTWQSFRDHLILEYEVPKWDGDLGQPNFYVPLTAEVLARKITLLESSHPSQRSKDWFDAETFRGLARLRGMECRAPDRYAEAFFMRKAIGAFG